MGLFSAGKKLFKKAVKVSRPFVVPAAAALGGSSAAEFAAAALGGAPQPAPLGLPQVRGGPIAAPFGLPAVGGRLPPLTRGLPRGGPRGLPMVPGAMVACPPGYHAAKDGSGRCVRNRRMNVLNPRAASRAIRRIKGAMRMLRNIERQLPKQRSRAPAGHRARLTHR